MFSDYYYLILGLQGFCLYHAYKNNNTQKWMYLIIFIPVIGSIMYLYDNFYSHKNIDNFGESMKRIVNTNYDVERLEKELHIANTISNKIALCDAYLNIGRYDDALVMCNESLQGGYANDVHLKMKKVQCLYMLGRYQDAVTLGEEISNHPDFKKSDQRIALAVCYANIGADDKAEQMFSSMNFPYCNYKHRVQYYKYLLQRGRKEDAMLMRDKLNEEFNLMNGLEKKTNAMAMKEFREIKNAI
jgi:hypothetical protein